MGTSETSDSFFRPKTEPARTLYDALQKETAYRSSRTVVEWIVAERNAMWNAARRYAQTHGLRAPTLAEVEEAEDYACGSTDYGAKWAHKLAEKMRAGTITRWAPRP